MPFRKIALGFAVFVILLIGALAFHFLTNNNYSYNMSQKEVKGASVGPLHNIVIVGDSMTEKLGNSDELREELKKYYPDKRFDVLNYGFGATNILSVEKRLTETVNYHRDFQPILNIDFDLIIFESMGHNPLSDYPLEQGLQMQNQTLDKLVSLVREKKPNAKIMFLGTIAPNSKDYAKNEVDLSAEKRKEWANERSAYIENHMAYAKAHNIPVIDVFDASKNIFGDGDLKYISDEDLIHPSPKGVILISKEIAKSIHENKIYD